jgi:hypothetical protein
VSLFIEYIHCIAELAISLDEGIKCRRNGGVSLRRRKVFFLRVEEGKSYHYSVTVLTCDQVDWSNHVASPHFSAPSGASTEIQERRTAFWNASHHIDQFVHHNETLIIPSPSHQHHAF